MGTCLRRGGELQQAVDRLSNCFNALHRDFGKLNAQLTPEVIVELSPDLSSREPGGIPKCACKRLRTLEAPPTTRITGMMKSTAV